MAKADCSAPSSGADVTGFRPFSRTCDAALSAVYRVHDLLDAIAVLSADAQPAVATIARIALENTNSLSETLDNLERSLRVLEERHRTRGRHHGFE